MASKYAKRYRIPEGFPEIMRDLTREVLRDFPRDKEVADEERWILEYAAKHFAEKAAGGGGSRTAASGAGAASGGGGGGGADFPTGAELAEMIHRLFVDADKDKSGTLDSGEFRQVVRQFADALGVPESRMRPVLAEADANEDGTVSYEATVRRISDKHGQRSHQSFLAKPPSPSPVRAEFLPIGVEVVEALVAKDKFRSDAAAAAEASMEHAADHLLHGLDREQLEQMLGQMFEQADEDKSGFLSRAEFANVLRRSDLGFSRREINAALMETDEDKDGHISYSEFVPVAFQLLLSTVMDQYELERAPADEAALTEYLAAHFEAQDAEKSGQLPAGALAEAISAADLGLSEIQVWAVVSEAEEDPETGMVDYARFASTAAKVVETYVDLQRSLEKSSALRALRSTDEELGRVGGMDYDAFGEALSGVLAPLDGGSGRAKASDVAAALEGMGAGLSQKQLVAVLRVGDAGDGSGEVVLQTVLGYAFDTLVAMQEQERLGTL